MTSVSHICMLIVLPSQAFITDTNARITKVEEDEAKLTTHLTAAKAPWSDVARSYDLDFGRAIATKNAHQRRGFFGTIKDTLSGDVDKSQSVSFPLNVGTPGVVTPIVSTSVSVPNAHTSILIRAANTIREASPSVASTAT